MFVFYYVIFFNRVGFIGVFVPIIIVFVLVSIIFVVVVFVPIFTI